jgi:hypothetical protein
MSYPRPSIGLELEIELGTATSEEAAPVMCLAGQAPAPTTATEAVAMAQAGLSWLAGADAGSLTNAEQADVLRGLGRAESIHTAAQARVLGAFHAKGGYEDDGVRHEAPMLTGPG